MENITMENIIFYLGIFIWSFGFLFQTGKYQAALNNKIITFNWLKKDLYKESVVYKTALIVLYLYISTFHDPLASSFVFAAISLDFLVSVPKCKKRKKSNNDIANMFIVLVSIGLGLIPFIVYTKLNDLFILHLLMIGYLVFNKYIVVIINIFFNKVTSIRGRK